MSIASASPAQVPATPQGPGGPACRGAWTWCSTGAAADLRRCRLRSSGTPDQQRPQARSLHSVWCERTLPVVIWTGGSAWMADTGKRTAPGVAAQLLPAGYARRGRLDSLELASEVSGAAARHQGGHSMAARERREVQPRPRSHRDHGRQLRRLDGRDGRGHRRRAGARRRGGDDGRVEQGAGGGRLLSADELPGDGRVGAAAMRPPGCHDDATSPESRLVGCAIQTCPEKVQAANPLRYITAADPPMMILHGGSDPLVPHNQGEQLYMALNKACRESVFISLPEAGHGPWNGS